MKKFYAIKQKDASNPYELILLIANLLPKSQVLIESSFAKSQGIQETLYSVDFADCEAFEELLIKNSFGFEEKSLYDNYLIWESSMKTTEIKSDDDFLDLDNIILVGEYSFSKIIENNRGLQSLNESEVVRQDSIKIYTNSNEDSGHHIPHVHIWYGNNKNYCVISLIDYSVIEPERHINAKIRKAIDLLKKDIAKARIAWNQTSGKLKFSLDMNGIPTSEIERFSKSDNYI